MCVSEQSAQRQHEMELGLLSLMGQKRYEDITVSELCTSMNIPRKAFYRYFSSKDGALYALIDHVILSSGQLPANNDNNINAKNSLLNFFEYWKNQKALLDALDRSGISGILAQRSIMQALNETSLKNFFESGNKADYERVACFVLSGLMATVISWHKSGFKDSPEEMAVNIARMLTNPLVKLNRGK